MKKSETQFSLKVDVTISDLGWTGIRDLLKKALIKYQFFDASRTFDLITVWNRAKHIPILDVAIIKFTSSKLMSPPSKQYVPSISNANEVDEVEEEKHTKWKAAATVPITGGKNNKKKKVEQSSRGTDLRMIMEL